VTRSGVTSTACGFTVAVMLVAAPFGLLAAGRRSVQGAPTAAQQPTFALRTEAVRIDALVMEGGHAVLGLQAADFEVRDNGVLQQVDLVSFDRVPLTVIFTLDVSESVRGERLVSLRAAARSLLDGLHAQDEAALVTFDGAVARPCEVTTEHRRVAAALDAVETGRGTALVDAVYAGMTLGAPLGSRVLMIVFSDGLDISSWLAPDAVTRAARHSDVVAYAVTVGASKAPSFGPKLRTDYEGSMKRVLDSGRFLADLADTTGGTVFDLDSAGDLRAAFGRILAEFRQRYLVSYVPRSVSRDGWHKVEVSIRGRRGATVKARSGYQVR
jgi:VWFA-related protein